METGGISAFFYLNNWLCNQSEQCEVTLILSNSRCVSDKQA